MKRIKIDEWNVMKKVFTPVIAVVIIMVILAGCSGKETAKSTADEFVGKFSGEAGSLEFLSEGKVEVSFSDDYIWMIMAAGNNNKTHQYRFVTKKNETVSFDKAEYVNFSNEEGVLIISNPCTVQEDRIVLYPSSVNETILDREAE